jgi:predicted ATP-binding protein involved in virulence
MASEPHVLSPMNIRNGKAPSPAMSNAYFLAMSLQNVRCFSNEQVLSFQNDAGSSARWTLILGDNGIGKTTLLQLLALGAVVEETLPGPDGVAYVARAPRLSDYGERWLVRLMRVGQAAARVKYNILWANSLDQNENAISDESVVEAGPDGGSTQTLVQGTFFHQGGPSIVYGYGANRRRAPNGLTSEASDDPTQTLFDDDATLRNPEEWLLQNELVANTSSPLQDRARRQRDRVLDILTRILPGIDEIRVASHARANQQLRASAEVHGPDGWVPFSSLGLGYRTMTAWIVDLSSRLFERYSALDDPLSGPAVCLVDEIDLHLHPRWQRDLIARLSTLFPRTQFIATAHSPLIVQAAPDANLIVLRRQADGVVIDNAPRSVRKWRVDQILTSELFDIPSARAPELDASIRERDEILAKAELTEQDENRLAELREKLAGLSHGDTPEDIEAMDVIRQAAKALKGKQGP